MQRVWTSSLGLMLLLAAAGCRRENPDWEGPSSSSIGSAEGSSTDSGTTTAPTTSSTTDGSATRTSDLGSSTGIELGAEGDPCESSEQCVAYCGPDKLCHDGSEDDPCENNGNCKAPLRCDMAVCTHPGG